MRAILKAICVVVVVGLVPASCAQAGEYHVYSCRTPAGEVAPVDGWSGSVAPGGEYDDYSTDTCGEGGALTASLEDATSHKTDVDLGDVETAGQSHVE